MPVEPHPDRRRHSFDIVRRAEEDQLGVTAPTQPDTPISGLVVRKQRAEPFDAVIDAVLP